MMTQILLVDGFVEIDLGSMLSIEEAKGLHSIKSTDEIRQRIIDMGFQIDKGEFRRARKTQTTIANRQFSVITDRMSTELLSLVKQYQAKTIGLTKFERETKNTFWIAYYDSFMLGLRSSGIGGTKLGREPTSSDVRYIESAFRHEMRYWNKLVKEIIRDSVRGSIERRVKNYVDALKHIYYSGRIMGTPRGWIIDWIAPLDRATCKGCRFLSDHSPYTNITLPTTPRAGDTACLMNCRCRLVARDIGPEKAAEIARGHGSKDWYERQLRSLK